MNSEFPKNITYYLKLEHCLMKLHHYKNAFEGAIVATAQHFGIAEILDEIN